MIGSVAVSEVQQILGWRSASFKADEILAALRYAQTQREQPGMTFPSWLWQEDGALAPTVIGSQEVALPSNYIQDGSLEDGGGNLRLRTSSDTRIFFLKKYTSLQVAEEAYFGVATDEEDISGTSEELATGRPSGYVLRSLNVRLYPIPDAVYTLSWSYWKSDSQVTLGVANAWLTNAPWVLIGEAAKKIGSDLGNANAVATATTILQKAEQDLFRSSIHRNEAAKRRSMGSRL